MKFIKPLGVVFAIAGGISLGCWIHGQDLTSRLPAIAGTLVGGLSFGGVLELARRKRESSTTAEFQAPQLPPAITSSQASTIAENDTFYRELLRWTPPESAIETSPICQNCSSRYLSNNDRYMCHSGHQSPVDNAFECIDFEPIHQESTCPRACGWKPAKYPQRRLDSEANLRAELQKPIRIQLLQKWIGSRDVWIYAPWSDRDDDLSFDICLGETPHWENHEGGIRMACTGWEDYYCNVGSREAAVFAWEVNLAAAIAESQESFERFWSDPERFVAALPNPNNYKFVIEN